MLSSFQPGQRRPANGLSALLHTGHHVTGPPPGRLSTHAGVPASAGHTGRPGPQPHTASMATLVSRRNAATHRVMRQVVAGAQQQVRLPTLPFSAYQPGTAGRDPWQETKRDAAGQPWFATQVQELWVYSHQIDHFGTREFRVYNPRTKVWAHFIPLGYIADKKQIQGIASATGEFGRVYFNFLAGTAATFATMGVALEFEAGTAALASTRGVLIRCGSAVAGQATRLAGQIAEEFTIRNFIIKGSVDATIQFGSGLLTKHDVRLALGGINGVSILLAGIMPEAEGWLPAVRNSTVTATLKAGVRNDSGRWHMYLDTPELHSMEGAGKYLLDITFGALADKMKGNLFAGVTPVYGSAMGSLEGSSSAFLRWFAAQRIILGTVGTIMTGAGIDAGKDWEKERMEKRLPGAKKENKE